MDRGAWWAIVHEAARVGYILANIQHHHKAPSLKLLPLLINGNPLQYSCLEDPMDGGALWATVHGLQSRTQLKPLTATSGDTANIIVVRTRTLNLQLLALYFS